MTRSTDPMDLRESGELGYASEREAVVEAIVQLQKSSVLSRSGHANLSSKIASDRIVITNSGFVLGIAPSDLVLMTGEGAVIDGVLEPVNQEIVDMHTAVYRSRPDVGAIVHTHSPYLLAFAMANCELPSRYEAQIRTGQTVPVPVVPWAPRGTEASVRGIVDAIEAEPETQAVLLGNHGVLVFAKDIGSTVLLLAALEEAAEAELLAGQLGGAADLPISAAKDVADGRARFNK